MDAAGARGGRGLFEGLYRFVMRRNSVYVTFVIAGAFLGERVGLQPALATFSSRLWIPLSVPFLLDSSFILWIRIRRETL
ncbi:hypothetical protein Taro_029125 [Colocasia esculenta]|uniref:Complex III subunit 9 n=1 Tax=Colocasia esculenta TaxID=4460 RepID=A0A843VWA8_COLES|nr:hypothetical protein [Colocasia esculenta]